MGSTPYLSERKLLEILTVSGLDLLGKTLDSSVRILFELGNRSKP